MKMQNLFLGIAIAMAMTFAVSTVNATDAGDGEPQIPPSGSGGGLQMDLPYTANNVGSPVKFIVSGSVLRNVIGYSVSFGNDVGHVLGWAQPVDYYPDLSLVFRHTYSTANYDGYKVTFKVYTLSGTYTLTRTIPVWVAGDANGDGVVNKKDAKLVKKHLGTKYGDKKYSDGADLNNDGFVDLLDAALVVY